MIDQNVITLIVALLINVPTLLMLRSNRKKVDAEGARLEDEITERVLIRANGEIEKLQARVTALESEIEEYKIGVGLLMGQLINARLEPTWRPRGVKIPPAGKSSSGFGTQ